MKKGTEIESHPEEMISKPKMIETGASSDTVQDALRMLGRSQLIHNIKEAEWRTIQQLFEQEFELSNTTGTKKISSKLLLQVAWKVVNKMKFLDFDIYGTKQSDNRALKNKIMTAALSTIVDQGGLAQALRDKGGVFYKAALFGDAFMQIGSVEGSGFPIQYRVCSLSDVYFDNGCTDVRDPVSGLSANEAVMIYRYSWGQFIHLYPEYKDKVVKGSIPRSLRWRKQLEKTWIQTFYNDEDLIEVAHYWNLAEKSYVMFAGGACTPLIELMGDEYPYMMDDQAYLPIIHFKFFPSTEGFYNWGLGHVLYDLATVASSLDNMAYNHAQDNVYPINFVNVPQGQASKIFAKIREANEQRKAGGKGFAVMEYGAGDMAGRSGVTLEPFQSQPITQEWERAFTRIERQVTRLGFELDAADRGANLTATQILSEQESADQTLKQVGEFNASESLFLVKVTLNMLKNLVSVRDKTPIQLTAPIVVEGQTLDLTEFTLGEMTRELKTDKYFARINSRSGVIPSHTMQLAQISTVLPTLTPGSPAQLKTILNLAQLNNQSITMEDLAPKPQATAPGSPAEITQPPSETDVLKAQLGFKGGTNPIAAF